jgi:hypothetical protein
VTAADRDENNFSLREGFRILSVYHSAKGRKIWIGTEAERNADHGAAPFGLLTMLYFLCFSYFFSLTD